MNVERKYHTVGFQQGDGTLVVHLCSNCFHNSLSNFPRIENIRNFVGFALREDISNKTLYISNMIVENIQNVPLSQIIIFIKQKIHTCYCCSALLYNIIVDVN